MELGSRPRVLDVSSVPVLSPGELGCFDDSGAILSWITPNGKNRHMYYVGWNRGVTVPFRNALGLAISSDGQPFQRYAKGSHCRSHTARAPFCRERMRTGRRRDLAHVVLVLHRLGHDRWQARASLSPQVCRISRRDLLATAGRCCHRLSRRWRVRHLSAQRNPGSRSVADVVFVPQSRHDLPDRLRQSPTMGLPGAVSIILRASMCRTRMGFRDDRIPSCV